MSDDDSALGRVRRAISGPPAAERAETLNDRASDEPASIDADDVDTLVELLDDDDSDVVEDTLHAFGRLAEERPELVTGATPAIVADLSTRPDGEWRETSIGEMSDEFMQDLSRASILLTLATDDPTHLDPVAAELASNYTGEDTLDPISSLALAHVVAADPDRLDLSREPFVEWVATELDAIVTADSDDVGMQLAETDVFVELLAEFGGETARETLELARRESDEEEVVRAADRAFDRLTAE